MIAAALLCLVVGISDGDSLTVRCGAPGDYQEHRVRIAAIDAPERGQTYSQRARQTLSALCYRQQATIVQTAVDDYGRVVGDVQCRGQDAGQHMVRTGMAWAFDRRPYTHRHLYDLQDAAKAARIGLWEAVDTDKPPIPPWRWRPAYQNAQQPIAGERAR
ncbi:MAG: thermonuclease family protein [Brachymonas sp.]|nr:thermonuclease family protein [Brachymonas sp.]